MVAGTYRMFITSLFFCIGLTVSTISMSAAKDYFQLKAIFLYNFANFVEWPSTAFKTKESPIELCLYGKVPFSKFLNSIDGTFIGDRQLIIKQYDINDSSKSGCQMMFVGENKKSEIEAFWSNKRHLYVLSIGETDDFINSGGIINIMRNQDTFTFDINLESAMKNGLFISSDLLILARKVTGLN